MIGVIYIETVMITQIEIIDGNLPVIIETTCCIGAPGDGVWVYCSVVDNVGNLSRINQNRGSIDSTLITERSTIGKWDGTCDSDSGSYTNSTWTHRQVCLIGTYSSGAVGTLCVRDF